MSITGTPFLYHNVLIVLLAQNDKDKYHIQILEANYKAGRSMSLLGISDWCTVHQIQFETSYYWRKDYPMLANLWNLYTYTRWRFERIIF